MHMKPKNAPFETNPSVTHGDRLIQSTLGIGRMTSVVLAPIIRLVGGCSLTFLPVIPFMALAYTSMVG